MKKIIALILIISFTNVYALSSNCNGIYHFYISGSIKTQPIFHSDKIKDQIELSHTLFYIDTEDSGIYQVSIDNVFAIDFNPKDKNSIPYSFKKALKVGNKIQLCGIKYTIPHNGVHWVHTNCDKNDKGPTGYVIVNGINLTDSHKYCNLWK